MSAPSFFESAASAGIITRDQAVRLAALQAEQGARIEAIAAQPAAKRFDLTHVLWYAGALIVMTSMGLFTTLAFSAMGSSALLATAIVYAGMFTAGAHYLWYRRALIVPGGLLMACAVAMVPMAVYAIQDLAGWWDISGKPGNYQGFYIWIKSGWLPMEIATVVAAIVAIRFFPFGFIAMVAAFALWFMSMDIVPWLLTGKEATWEQREKISMYFGVAMMAGAWVVDIAQRRADYAYWLHLFGLITFWGALSMQHSGNEVSKFLYCLINVGLIALSVILTRRSYAMFGAIGIVFYLGNISHNLFKNSLLFPFALSGLGIGLIAIGLYYYRHADHIEAVLEDMMPPGLKALRPRAIA